MMDKRATCTGHSIACIRHKTQTTPTVHLVYFSDLITGGIGHMPAVGALRHILTFHQVVSGQSAAPLTVSTIIINLHHVLNRGVFRRPLIAFAKTPILLNCVNCLINRRATSVPTTIVCSRMYATCVDRAHTQQLRVNVLDGHCCQTHPWEDAGFTRGIELSKLIKSTVRL